MRISFNVNGLNVGDESYFYKVVRELKPTTILIMNNMEMALRIYDMNEGQTQVVHRIYSEDDGGFWKSKSPRDIADMVINQKASRDHRHIWKQVLNDVVAGGSDWEKVSNWMTENGQHIIDAGHKVVSGNFAVGSYELSDIQNGYFDKWLKFAGDNKDSVAFGVHEYTAFLLPFGIGLWPSQEILNPEFVQQHNWPKPELIPDYIKDYGRNYHHLMRSTWFNFRAKTIGATSHNTWVTEFGLDRMVDLYQPQHKNIYEQAQNKFGVTASKEYRGMYSHAPLWNKYYPQWNTSETIFQQLKWADSIYPNWYTGFMLFMWSTGDEWDKAGFNFAADRELHDKLIQYAKTNPSVNIPVPSIPVPEPVVIPPIDKPADTTVINWQKGYVTPQMGKFNIRKEAGTHYSVISVVGERTLAMVAIEHAEKFGAETWYPIRINSLVGSDKFDLIGYVRSDVFSFEPILSNTPSNPEYETLTLGIQYYKQTGLLPKNEEIIKRFADIIRVLDDKLIVTINKS